MAIVDIPGQASARQMDARRRSALASLRKKAKCVVCEGELEKSNVGMMCHSCKDRLSGKHTIPTADASFGREKRQPIAVEKIKLKKTRGVV